MYILYIYLHRGMKLNCTCYNLAATPTARKYRCFLIKFYIIKTDISDIVFINMTNNRCKM